MTGYLDPAYVQSLSEWGQPIHLPRSGGWLIERVLPASGGTDALGPYPFLVCRDWNGLGDDVARLEGSLVSLSLVTDPLGDINEASLRAAFPERCVRFKDHFVVDLEVPREEAVRSHHRRNAARGLSRVRVEVARDPPALLEAWCDLYGLLVARHGILGPTRFSRSIFARQLAVPGLRVLTAERDGEIVGMTLWYEQGSAAYYHLGAYSPAGYESGASFAIFWTAFDVFRGRVRWLALGGGAGLGQREDGLTRFKRGWATGVRPTYLCGAILDPVRYRALAGARPATAYFPAYRAGEFA